MGSAVGRILCVVSPFKSMECPVDYVIGTGRRHLVKEFIQRAFDYAGLDWSKYIKTDPRYLRLTEVGELQARNR